MYHIFYLSYCKAKRMEIGVCECRADPAAFAAGTDGSQLLVIPGGTVGWFQIGIAIETKIVRIGSPGSPDFRQWWNQIQLLKGSENHWKSFLRTDIRKMEQEPILFVFIPFIQNVLSKKIPYLIVNV